MKVFVVTFVDHNHNTHCCGIFNTLTEARNYIDSHKHFDVIKWDIMELN